MTTMKSPKKTRTSKKAIEPAKPVRVFNTAPVIVKCTGEGCDKREQCVRFTSQAAALNQPWFTESVAIPDKKKCKFLIEITPE